MKKKLLLAISLALVLIMVLSVAGSAFVSVPVKGVKLNKTEITINVGQTYALKATVTPSNATNKVLKWISDNSKVVTVDSKGVLTGVKKGKANITVQSADSKISVKCRVNVEESKATVISVFGPECYVEGVSLNDGLAVFKAIEKKVNVKIKWNVSSKWTEVLLTKLAAGQQLDDIMCIAYNDPTKYIKAGLFQPLDSLIDKYGPNLKAFFAKYPQYKTWNTFPGDGKVYSLTESSILGAKEQGGFNLQGRQDWLDKLGLKVPETSDDLYKALVAIKTKDPNGNGKADEVPWCDSYNAYTIAYVTNMYGMHGLYNGYVYPDSSGKVIMEVTTGDYKNALMYLNRLYKEKLLDPEWETLTGDILKKRLAANVVGFFTGNPYGNNQFSGIISGADPKAKNVILMPVKGPTGKQVLEMPRTEWKRYVITKDCKNPDAAMRLLDFAFASDEGIMFRNYGIKGVTYNIVNGQPVFTKEIVKSKEVYKAKNKYGIQQDTLPMVYAPFTKSEMDAIEPALKKGADERVKYFSDSYLLTSVLQPEKNVETLKKMTDINTYVSEATMKFITGKQSFDQWDAYVKKLKDLGIEDCQKAYQDTYNSLYKK